MIFKFFRKDPNLEPAEALYSAVVEQARTPALYSDLGVPDTVEGRFEMVSLHAYLVLRGLKGAPDPASQVSQKLFDVMFENMDASLRELGVGDLSVGRKIRKMAENFFGRAGAYEAGLKTGAPANALAGALARNIFEQDQAEEANKLAIYVRQAADFVCAQPAARIAGGIVQFPEVGHE